MGVLRYLSFGLWGPDEKEHKMSASYQETELLGGQTVWQETRADEAIYAISPELAVPLVQNRIPLHFPVSPCLTCRRATRSIRD